MSLVEQALKKLQASRVTPDKPAPVVPRAATHGGAEAVAMPLPVPQRSTRVVHIDREAMRAAGLLPAQTVEKRISQELRHIKRPLIANALGRGTQKLPNGHVIMMASALPGDGKTFTAINLALSMALEKDVRILLVDADVPKPHVSRTFGMQGETGLLDVLRDEHMDVESVILDTDVPNLSILPAGKPSETATELLASSRMLDVVQRLGSVDAQRIVIVDSPPLLYTTESRALTAAAGQIVLVIGANSTPQKAVFDALELLGEDKSIGLVLNQCDEGSTQGYYNYYGQEAETSEAP